MVRLFFFLSLLGSFQISLAWNSTGHKLIAQIAYDHLEPQAKRTFNYYNRALDRVYPPKNFVNAGTWLDEIRYKNGVNWFNTMHYVDWYFTEDSSPLPSSQPLNAIWAIKEAKKILKSKKTSEFDKGISLRILIHLTGDLHQPLHAVSRVSTQYPEGDAGGTKIKLSDNALAQNLHTYWDLGAGYLMKKQRFSQSNVKKMARSITVRYPCYTPAMGKNPEKWAKESYDIGLKVAYTIKEGTVPDANYQKLVQAITEKRLALAGCRLASILNSIHSNYYAKIVKKNNK